jgi:hypothetical protein
MSTLSANLTLDGLLFSLAFLAAERRADLRQEDWNNEEEEMNKDLEDDHLNLHNEKETHPANWQLIFQPAFVGTLK